MPSLATMVCATEKERVSGKRESLIIFTDVLTEQLHKPVAIEFYSLFKDSNITSVSRK